MGIMDTVKGYIGDRTQVKGFAEGLNSYVKQSGGMNGLKARFEKEGAGAIFQSWLGAGPSLPITKEQLEKIMGNQFIQDMAKKMGLDTTTAAEKLTHMMPIIINKLSPGGRLPSDIDEKSLLAAAKDFIKKEH